MDYVTGSDPALCTPRACSAYLCHNGLCYSSGFCVLCSQLSWEKADSAVQASHDFLSHLLPHPDDCHDVGVPWHVPCFPLCAGDQGLWERLVAGKRQACGKREERRDGVWVEWKGRGRIKSGFDLYRFSAERKRQGGGRKEEEGEEGEEGNGSQKDIWANAETDNRPEDHDDSDRGSLQPECQDALLIPHFMFIFKAPILKTHKTVPTSNDFLQVAWKH